MKTTDLHLRRAEWESALLPLLLGRAFHVTLLRSLSLIQEGGEIRPNYDGQLPTSPFGSTNAYSRNHGRVSVFDYRSATGEQIDASLGKCSVLSIASRGKPFACLFLSAHGRADSSAARGGRPHDPGSDRRGHRHVDATAFLGLS